MLDRPKLHAPLGLLAELTHRCPLGCPYCSNPLELDARHSELDTETWTRVFREAAALGVLQTHLSGGEPASRRDLEEIAKARARCRPLRQPHHLRRRHCRTRGWKSSRMPASITCRSRSRIPSRASADHIAGYAGAYARKQALARAVAQARSAAHRQHGGAPRQHRHASATWSSSRLRSARPRIEIAHVQYYGWAHEEPRRADADARAGRSRGGRSRCACASKHKGEIVIDAVVPDYYARYPKACMGGWARRSLNVTPGGRALPCHAAEIIPGLEFWNVREHSLARHLDELARVQRLSWHRRGCRSLAAVANAARSISAAAAARRCC